MRQKSMLTSYKVDFGRPGGRQMSTSTTFWSRSGKCDFLMIFESCTKRPKVMQNGTGVPQRGPDSLPLGFPQGHFAIYPGIHVISTTLSIYLLIFIVVTVLMTGSFLFNSRRVVEVAYCIDSCAVSCLTRFCKVRNPSDCWM